MRARAFPIKRRSILMLRNWYNGRIRYISRRPFVLIGRCQSPLSSDFCHLSDFPSAPIPRDLSALLLLHISIDNSIFYRDFYLPFSLSLSLSLFEEFVNQWTIERILFSLSCIWRIINVCYAYLFKLSERCRNNFFFFSYMYIYIYSINIEWKMEARNLVRRIKWRAALIVNSINRLKLEIKIDKLLSFFPSTTRGGLDWDAFEKKGRGGKKRFVSYYESNYERDVVMESRIEYVVSSERTPFVSVWNEETIDTGGGEREGWLSTIIIGAIVALLCRLRYGDYLFEQQVVLKTAINRRRLQFMSVERFFLPFPSSYLSRARKRKLIIGSPIIHHLRMEKDERSVSRKSWIFQRRRLKNTRFKEGRRTSKSGVDNFYKQLLALTTPLLPLFRLIENSLIITSITSNVFIHDSSTYSLLLKRIVKNRISRSFISITRDTKFSAYKDSSDIPPKRGASIENDACIDSTTENKSVKERASVSFEIREKREGERVR